MGPQLSLCFSTHHAHVTIATQAGGTSCPCASCMALKAPWEQGRVPGSAAERSPPPAPPNQDHGAPPVKHNQQIPSLSWPQPGAAVLCRAVPASWPRFSPAPPLLVFFFLTQF